MISFRGADVQRAIAVVDSVGDPDRPDPFPRETLELLRDLMDAEAVGYCESPRLIGFGGYELGTRTPPQWLQDALRDVAQQDPTHSAFHGDACSTVTVSDLLSRRAVERLGIYSAIWEPLGVQDSLRLYVGGAGETCRFLFFDRSSRGFSLRGRRLLELLRPMMLRAREEWRSPPSAPTAVLSLREAEVLRWVAAGLTNQEIGRRLWLSPNTVRKHLENTYRKLGVHTRTQAAARVGSTARGKPARFTS